jgi:hypothetical protein
VFSYADDNTTAPVQTKSPVATELVPESAIKHEPAVKPEPVLKQEQDISYAAISSYDGGQTSGPGDYGYENGSGQHDQYTGQEDGADDEYGPIGIKEDG